MHKSHWLTTTALFAFFFCVEVVAISTASAVRELDTLAGRGVESPFFHVCIAVSSFVWQLTDLRVATRSQLLSVRFLFSNTYKRKSVALKSDLCLALHIELGLTAALEFTVIFGLEVVGISTATAVGEMHALALLSIVGPTGDACTTSANLLW